MHTFLSILFCSSLFIMVQYANSDPMRCLKSNEILLCKSPCPEKTCQTRNVECTMKSEDYCRVGCVCRNGFYRDFKENCVSENDCDRLQNNS